MGREQAAGVQHRLGDNVIVDVAMRYGQPSIDLGIDRLMAKGCRKIGILPLYPQYAGAPTGSVYDGVANALKDRMNIPDVRYLRDYHEWPAYISALGDSIKDSIADLDFEPDVILASYHGLPQSYVDKGDPYQDECLRTTELLRAYLGYDETRLRTTFQSRFGPKQWLQPYTDKTLEALPEQGVKKAAVVTPGFAADCLETLEEIAMEAKEIFEEAGGTHFAALPCLNTRPDHLDMLAGLAQSEILPGWL
jgi:ferrochelatase